MKQISLTILNDEEWYLNIPENYEKKPLPYFDKWIDALESGNYLQGKNRLCTEIDEKGTKSYCCLGVLSDVQNLLVHGRDCEISPHYLSRENPNYSFFGENGSFSPLYISNEKGKSINLLSEMNDEGFSFLEIVEVIKQIWKSEEKLDKTE